MADNDNNNSATAAAAGSVLIIDKTCSHKKGRCYLCFACCHSQCPQYCQCPKGPNRNPKNKHKLMQHNQMMQQKRQEERDKKEAQAAERRKERAAAAAATKAKKQEEERQRALAASKAASVARKQKAAAKAAAAAAATKAAAERRAMPTTKSTTSGRSTKPPRRYSNDASAAVPTTTTTSSRRQKENYAQKQKQQSFNTNKRPRPTTWAVDDAVDVEARLEERVTKSLAVATKRGGFVVSSGGGRPSLDTIIPKRAAAPVAPSGSPPHFAAIVGHDALKSEIESVVVKKQKKAEREVRPRSILLYGPRGCGKTLLAKAIAAEAHAAAFLKVTAKDIVGKTLQEMPAVADAILKRARDECLAESIVQQTKQTEQSDKDKSSVAAAAAAKEINNNNNKSVVIFIHGMNAMSSSLRAAAIQDKSNPYNDPDGDLLAHLYRRLDYITSFHQDSQQQQQQQQQPVEAAGAGATAPASPSHAAQQKQKQQQQQKQPSSKPTVLLVASTICRPEFCDDYLWNRSFGTKLAVEMPNDDDREEMLLRFLDKVENHTITLGELHRLIDWTDGWSGADLKNLTDQVATRACFSAQQQKQQQGEQSAAAAGTEAAAALGRRRRPVHIGDFEDAIVAAACSSLLSASK